MSSETTQISETLGINAADDVTSAMVAKSGSYELLKKRLAAHGETLSDKTRNLNNARLAEFGQSEQSLVLRTRARTENNCVARDIVRIGDRLLFGYNVFIGLRKETSVEDVFAFYRLTEHEGSEELEALPLTDSFLEDSRFISDFRELYAYYKQASLLQLRVTHDKLLAAFQIGQKLHDLRVFRWSIERNGEVRYIDNRGERDIALPPSQDFEWTLTTREDQVSGRHPHVNILDTVFIETLGGDLTVKIENNTEAGLGIYSEPVEDKNQSLADAEISYVRLGLLILLRVRPYREQTVRYLVFNIRTQQVERIDAIGISCVQLPEDHGIIFPSGYYLQSGEYKRFDLPRNAVDNLRFKRMIRSPNGEDMLYVFYQPESGSYALFTYNLIEKSLTAPILNNGYARFPDGRILVFQSNGDEPTRLHPMQLWRTPFYTEEYASAQPVAQGFFGRIGNAELVRGVSDLLGIARVVRDQAPTRAAYEDLIRQCARMLDAYFWLTAEETGGLAADLRAIAQGARSTLDEFEKVDSLRRETGQALAKAEREQRSLLTDIASTLWHCPENFISALGRLREGRGHLQTLKELRYVDLPRLEVMDGELTAEQQRVGEEALQFLAGASAFDSQRQNIEKISAQLAQADSAQALGKLLGVLDQSAIGLDLLSEQLGGLPGGDAVMRTAILDRISLLYAEINRLRAEARIRHKTLGASENAAEFGAQFKLFSQSVENALEFADTPDKCDDVLTRLLAQLEELEGRFAEQEGFAADLAIKRETVYEALSGRRQSLIEAQQRRAQSLSQAGARILDGIPRRLAQFTEVAQVYTYFVSDPLISKLHKLMEDLRKLGAGVAADDLDTRVKTARDQGLREARDRLELITEGGDTLRLGIHSFTINRQPLEIALLQKDQVWSFHLTGTDYYQAVNNVQLEAYRSFWKQSLLSETETLTRAEYLAGSFLQASLNGKGDLTWEELQALCFRDMPGQSELTEHIRHYAASRYREGYQKGVHDADAARLLGALVAMQSDAGLLAWGPTERALALLYWQYGGFLTEQPSLLRRARAALEMQTLFKGSKCLEILEVEVGRVIAEFATTFAPGPLDGYAFGTDPKSIQTLSDQAAAYLIRQLANDQQAISWVISGAGEDLARALTTELERSGRLIEWQNDLASAPPTERWRVTRDWLTAFTSAQGLHNAEWIDDAASLLAVPIPRLRVNAKLDRQIEGLLGEHPLCIAGRMRLNLNDFWRRFVHHHTHVVPGFEALQTLRQNLLPMKNRDYT